MCVCVCVCVCVCMYVCIRTCHCADKEFCFPRYREFYNIYIYIYICAGRNSPRKIVP